ncbi:extracellular solute-binding protein [Tessaracoccus sp. HDW20]|uniref:extracellular solute-binding protein n=1 Tax=Tessaracoccus coleopterorum TaxID=2714950 RepID=UPI0018D28615|nr:extracellular solute-binding protein [Tessaracoccus coleopterorum]NHB84372.1 extracellular solute-binding protein [Tessaracoccus coleopterorum]
MIAAAALTVAAAVSLSACGSTTPAGSPEPQSSAGTTEEWWSAAPESVTGTVRFWNWGDTSDVADEAIAAFNKVYPNITVEAKTVSYKDYVASLSAALASGEGPTPSTSSRPWRSSSPT